MNSFRLIAAELLKFADEYEQHGHLPDDHDWKVIDMQIAAQREMIERGLIEA